MSLTGARHPSWRFVLLDEVDQPLGDLGGVVSGTVEVAATTRLGSSGSLTIIDTGQVVDWMRHRVQISYDPGVAGVDGWPVATLMFTSPTTVANDDKTVHSVELLSKMAVIDEDTVEERYSLPAGTGIVSTVLALIRSTGETRIAATESPATLTNPLHWDAGTSKLTIINDLLEVAGFWSLWCDGSGQFRVEKWVPPGERPVSWLFEAGEAAIHEAGWQHTQDLSSVPNRFVVVGQGSDDVPALSAWATNEDPDSPFSYQARGRWITRTESGVEGTLEALQMLAQRRLLDAMSPVAKREVKHAVVPLDPNMVVDFRPARGTPVLATVQRMSYDLRFDGQCSAEWRVI